MGADRLTERELYETPLLVDVEEAAAGGCSLLCATGGGTATAVDA
jgi:hypothetical protein